MDSTEPTVSVKEIGFAQFDGNGLLASATKSHNVQFIVYRQLASIVIVIREFMASATWRERVSLSGKLSDGRGINIAELKALHIQSGLTELKPWNCTVELGTPGSSNPSTSRYCLSGLYEGNFTIEINGWQLSLCSNGIDNAVARASRRLRAPLVGSTLEITSEDKSRAQHENCGWDVLLLLSLACGTEITCNRWNLDYKENETLEVWSEKAGGDRGPGPIIASFCFQHFLQQVFPVWRQMSDRERHVIRVAIRHLNVSGSGYLDNRLFQVAQIWEFLAGCWVPSQSLTNAEEELKRDLLQRCNAWRKRYGEDPEARISQRVSFAFSWPVLKRQITELASMLHVDISDFDLDHLKRARDAAGHSISLGATTPSSVPHHNLLFRAQKLIQIILLLKLEYRGLVVSEEDGWRTDVDIESFLVNGIF
jgi:hypothetical protein